MATFGNTLDAYALDPTTGLPLPGVELYAWADESGGTPLLSLLSGLDGSFGWEYDTTADGQWVSAGLTGPRVYVPSNDALASRATTVYVDERLATKANAATVGTISAKVDTTETRVGTVEDDLAGRLSDTALSSTFPLKGDVPLDPKDYGAVGDGVADDTSAWQICVNAAPAGATINGKGRTYLVSSVVFKSDLVVERAKFKTKSGTGNFRSPVTLGATASSTVVSNVRFRYITIDGNRTGQTALTASEDGGCHGFRILGPVQDILIEDCVATNCASDGLAIFSASSPLASYSTGVSSRVRVVRSKFNKNRRHGASADSVTDLVVEDCEMNGNGLNADGSITPGANNNGAMGAIMPTAGGLYGNGLDVEEYNLKTYAAGIRLSRCTMTGNAKSGVLFYQGGNLASDANWVTRTGFTIDGGTYDNGISAAADPYAIQFTPLGSNKATGWYYDDVQIEGARIIGPIGVLLRSVKTARHNGGRVTSTDPNYIGLADQVQSLKVGTIDRGVKRYSLDTATVDYPTSQSLWVGAGDFVPTTGAPVLSAVNRHPCLILSDAAIKRAAATVVFPSDWEKATITAYWAATVGTGGAVNIAVGKGSCNPGTTLATPVPSQGVFAADGGLNVVVATVLDTGQSVSGQMTIEVLRDGTAAGDTLAGDCALLGLRITRTA